MEIETLSAGYQSTLTEPSILGDVDDRIKSNIFTPLVN